VQGDTVQATLDIFENKLKNIVDNLVPGTKFLSNVTIKFVMPAHIKSKINKPISYYKDTK
jgi:hypothetical protein